MYRSFLILFFSYSLAIGQTMISGKIGGRVFKESGNPWIITNNIIIEKDQKTIIKPGCIFLFKPFTGLEVIGSLVVEGSKTHRVIFTSVNDSLYNKTSTQEPKPFEWNGIQIHTEANNTILSNFMLSYSVYGIQSKIPDIKIYRGYFRENGQFNFTVEGRIIYVENNYPFNYSNDPADIKNFYPSTETDNKRYPYLSIGSTVLGASFLYATCCFIYEFNLYGKEYDRTIDAKEINDYFNKKKSSRNKAIISGIVGGVFTSLGLKFLFFDRINKEKDGIIISSNRGELNITFLF
jgi:hypothetical protein